mmetsp:Transcript_22870/g.47716  ORF Transcript_22870/g.47716 Transcript_22870/m.47716 type:complete len:147 (+) Transcript_22870:961-1401(+)
MIPSPSSCETRILGKKPTSLFDTEVPFASSSQSLPNERDSLKRTSSSASTDRVLPATKRRTVLVWKTGLVSMCRLVSDKLWKILDYHQGIRSCVHEKTNQLRWTFSIHFLYAYTVLLAGPAAILSLLLYSFGRTYVCIPSSPVLAF